LIQLAVVLLGKETIALSEDHTALLGTALALGRGRGSPRGSPLGREGGTRPRPPRVRRDGRRGRPLGLFPGYFPLTLALLA
jgi:hypothetical protein